MKPNWSVILVFEMNVAERREILKTLIIPPDELVSSFSLLERAKKSLSPCENEYGYVIRVESAELAGSLTIDHTHGYITAPVRISIETILPKEGDIINGCVMRVHSGGIFIQYSKLHVLIPLARIEDAYEFSDDSYTNRKTGRVVKVGDWVLIKIIAVRYMNHEYRSLGELVEENDLNNNSS
jgi:DNA-directed RNA polymerase subunit E'/Rpb7